MIECYRKLRRVFSVSDRNFGALCRIASAGVRPSPHSAAAQSNPIEAAAESGPISVARRLVGIFHLNLGDFLVREKLGGSCIQTVQFKSEPNVH